MTSKCLGKLQSFKLKWLENATMKQAFQFGLFKTKFSLFNIELNKKIALFKVLSLVCTLKGELYGELKTKSFFVFPPVVIFFKRKHAVSVSVSVSVCEWVLQRERDIFVVEDLSSLIWKLYQNKIACRLSHSTAICCFSSTLNSLFTFTFFMF